MNDYHAAKTKFHLAFSTQNWTLQVKQSPFHPWTPSHCIVEALSRAGNSQSLSHPLPSVPTTAFETPTGYEQNRYNLPSALNKVMQK